MNPDGHGSVLGRFKVPTLAGQILAQHLEALAAPRHRAAVDAPPGSTDRGPVARPLRLGQAFVEYLETRGRSGIPRAGGVPATVVVTMTLDDLRGDREQAATLDTGELVSASEARRLACQAGIIPAVLGSASQVLDLGRRTRFHTDPQRVVIAQRDKGCATEGCDWPPSRCHTHHPVLWSRGGPTTVANGMLLCPRHHALAHDARYQLKAGKGGKVVFSRRT